MTLEPAKHCYIAVFLRTLKKRFTFAKWIFEQADFDALQAEAPWAHDDGLYDGIIDTDS